jgi:spore coat polysaccharide biosynthesis protein SpsF
VRIGALIPVRLSSERLPGKALIDMCGRPMIYHLLDRVCHTDHIQDPKDVVVCTTQDPGDDPLAEAVEYYGCSIFRGARDDIIKRFSDAIATFDFDAVIQADGDDPLSSFEYMDATMAHLIADPEIDIVTVQGLPLGTATKSFSRRAMTKVIEAYRTEQNDTGFIYFFTKSGICQHVELSRQNPSHRSDKARLTLDYPLDLELFLQIFKALYRPNAVFGLAEVVTFLDEHPELIELNLKVEEEYWQRTAEKAQLQFQSADGQVKEIKI